MAAPAEPCVALLRGVNVGGAGRLPMAQLRDLVLSLGWHNPRTLLASGNLVFRAGPGAGEQALAEDLERVLSELAGLDQRVVMRRAMDVREVLETCPYAPEDGSRAHVFFCASEPRIDEDRLAELKAPTERLDVRGRSVFLDAPEGIGRSALVARLERVVTGTVFTGRNLNTVRRIAALCAS